MATTNINDDPETSALNNKNSINENNVSTAPESSLEQKDSLSLSLEEKLTKSYKDGEQQQKQQEEEEEEDNIRIGSVSTSSSISSSSSDDDDNNERLNHILPFLKNPKISDVSYKEKEKYLLNKGFSLKDIQHANSLTTNNTSNNKKYNRRRNNHKRKKPQHRKPRRERRNVNDYTTLKNDEVQQPYLQDQRRHHHGNPSSYGINNTTTNDNSKILTENEEKMSSALVSTSMGAGASISIVAMASWRWLNGGDFELLPPPNNSTVNKIDDSIISVEDDDDDNDSDDDSETSLSKDEEKLDNNKQQEEEQNHFIISSKLDQLNDTMQILNTNFEKFLQTQTAQHHRNLTNNTIDLLRPSSSIAAADKKITSTPIPSTTTKSPEDNKKEAYEIIQKINNNKNSISTFQDSIRMLYLYLNNLKQNPSMSRYRKIYILSDSFQKNMLPLEEHGVFDLLNIVGFSKDDSNSTNSSWLEISNEKEIDLDLLNGIVNELSALLMNNNSSNKVISDNTAITTTITNVVSDNGGLTSANTSSEDPNPASE